MNKFPLLLCFLLMSCLSSASNSVRCDFNGDGFSDLAVGSPGEQVGTTFNSGGVSVIYGHANGLTATNNQFWNKNSSGVAGIAAANEFFGVPLTCGDFNGDGNSDLAIGAPGTEVNGQFNAGSITILYGSSNGLTGTGSQAWTKESPGILGVAEPYDGFGVAMASGDFNGDGNADLAIGSFGQSLQGSLNILYGSASGLTADGNQFWTQDSPGVPGSLAAGHRFAGSLAAGDFGKDTRNHCYDDLAIGIVGDTVDGHTNAGSVLIFYGSQNGLKKGKQEFTKAQFPATAVQNDDQFAATLATASFQQKSSSCGSKLSDLAIGAPFEIGNVYEGSVYVLYATDSGLSANHDQVFNVTTPGIVKGPDTQTEFGFALAANENYLAIGAPYDDVGTNEAAGAVHVLFTDPSTGFLTVTGNNYLTESTPVAFNQYGFAITTGNFDGIGIDDLAIGIPTTTSCGSVAVFYGANANSIDLWSQDRSGVLDSCEVDDQFGASLAQ